MSQTLVERRIRDWGPGSDVRRELVIFERWRNEVGASTSNDTRLLIGISKTGIRIKFPEGTRSPIQYLDKPSSDLQALTALWICDIVPTGVFADRLEEEHPGYGKVTEFMRQWETAYREQEYKP